MSLLCRHYEGHVPFFINHCKTQKALGVEGGEYLTLMLSVEISPYSGE